MNVLKLNLCSASSLTESLRESACMSAQKLKQGDRLRTSISPTLGIYTSRPGLVVAHAEGVVSSWSSDHVWHTVSAVWHGDTLICRPDQDARGLQAFSRQPAV